MVIDRQPEVGCDQLKRECKILLLSALPESFFSMVARTHPTLCLGPGESGKSTIVKQIKITHQGGFSPSELAEYRPVVYKNVLDSAQWVVIHMKKIGLECVEYLNMVQGIQFPSSLPHRRSAVRESQQPRRRMPLLHELSYYCGQGRHKGVLVSFGFRHVDSKIDFGFWWRVVVG